MTSSIVLIGEEALLSNIALFARRFEIKEYKLKAYIGIFSNGSSEKAVFRNQEDWIVFCKNSGYELDINELTAFINDGNFDANFMEVRCYNIEQSCKEK